MKPVILVDVDEVVADFVGKYLEISMFVTNKLFRREQVTQWDVSKSIDLQPWAKKEVEHLLSLPGVAHSIKLLPGAKEAVERLNEVGEVVFVTSPLWLSKTWAHDREEWLEVKFGQLGRKVIHTTQKEHVTGAVLIDDKPDNLVRWCSRNSGAPILWDQSHNRVFQENAPIIRMGDWDAVIDLIKKRTS